MDGINTIGEELLQTIENAGKGSGSSESNSNHIRKSHHKTQVLIKELIKIRSPKASEYLIKAYSMSFPDSLFFKNGGGIFASPCWVNIHLNTTLKCEINRALGYTGGEDAFNHLMKMAKRGFCIGQGMSYGSWIPSSAIEGLGVLGDERALPLLEKKTNTPFISDEAKQAINIIKSLTLQRELLKTSNVTKIFGVWLELTPDELTYDDYKVTKFIDYVFNGEYQTKKERIKEDFSWVEKGANDIEIYYPEDRFFAKNQLNSVEENIVRKYLEGKKKQSWAYRLGLKSLSRLYQIEKDLNEVFNKN